MKICRRKFAVCFLVVKELKKGFTLGGKTLLLGGDFIPVSLYFHYEGGGGVKMAELLPVKVCPVTLKDSGERGERDERKENHLFV